MEAVRIDTLPSTESNAGCSLLSTGARDSNDISKEKEEELLYGAGEEEVDEDEALSDDSLRLKFSDDEEADQDDAGSSEYFHKPVKQEDTSEDAKFETSEAFDTSPEEDSQCQQNSASERKSVPEVNVASEENCEEQTKIVGDLEESESFVEAAHDQDTIMNGNDPRYYQSVIRPNFESRWRQNSSRPRNSFNNHSSHQRSYYQTSNFGSSESEVQNGRYYNHQNHYSRSRGSGKSHYQNYNEHSNRNSNSRSLDRRKDSTYSPSLKVIETSNNKKSDQKNNDSTSDPEKTDFTDSGEAETISDSKIVSETVEESSPENGENEKENLNDCPTESESLPVDSPLTEEATVSSLQNTLMEVEEVDGVKEPQKPSNEERKEPSNEEPQVPSNEVLNEKSTEKDSKSTEVDEPEPIDEYAHLNESTGEFAGTSVDSAADENVKQCSNIEESKTNETEVLQNEEIDSSKIQSPDDDPEYCEEGEEDLGFETPTEDASSRKDVVSSSCNINTASDVAIEHVSTLIDIPMSVNDDSESLMDNLPKVYQCLEEIASMEASRLAEEKEKEVIMEKADSTKQMTESCDVDVPMTSEVSSTNQMTENCDEDVPMTSEKIISMEEDTSLQSDTVSKISEMLKESELLNEAEGENSNASMGSAETFVCGTPENVEGRLNEVEKMDFDDNACQSNEDAKAADAHKETILDGTEVINGALITCSNLIVEDGGNDVSKDVRNDVHDVSNDASNDVSNDVHSDYNTNDNTEIVEKVIEDDSNSRNSLFTENKVVEDEKREEDSKKDAKHINEVVDIEKMCVDDECLDEKSETSAEKNEVEASKISNDGSSSGNHENSTSATITLKVSDSNESKTDGTSIDQRKTGESNAVLPETSKIPPTEIKQGEGSGRQKRRTAKNAEELIRKKFLGNDSDVESDDSGKYVPVNYKSRNNLRSLSPPSLKRNLGKDDDDSFDSATVKKIKMNLEPPKLAIKEFKEEDDKKNVASIRTLASVRKFFQRDITGKLKKLKQEELEELLIQKIVETITMGSEIGKLREQARLSERNQEATRAKCQQLAKQIQDFDMVLKRNAADRSAGNDKYVAPIKINRSVGLQVNFISDHGMQNMRQIQQNAKSSMANAAVSTSDGTGNPKRGIKIRSPRRSESVTSTVMTPAVQSQVQMPTLSPVTPAALVSTKPAEPPRSLPMPVQTHNAQPVISSMNIRSPMKMSTMQAMQSTQHSQQSQTPQQTVILNGNIANRLPTAAAALNVQKPKSNNDLIDLTDEEEKTKSESKKIGRHVSNAFKKTPVSFMSQDSRVLSATVNAPMAVSTATILANSQNQRTIMQSHSTPHYQRVIQVPTSVALSNQTANIRVVQPNSQSTPTALVNNINAPRLTYLMQSGGQPRQILIANPNSIRQGGANRNQFSTLTYKTPNGIPTASSGTLRLLTTQANPNAQVAKHPAPLPDPGPGETNPSWKLPPPAPTLKISKVSSGIVLSWNMPLSEKHADIVSYQLFAYQEVSGTPPNTMLWKKVGDVMALPLPMACTLTQFSAGNNYYFAVRAVDTHSRLGQYSLPGNISL